MISHVSQNKIQNCYPDLKALHNLHPSYPITYLLLYLSNKVGSCHRAFALAILLV